MLALEFCNKRRTSKKWNFSRVLMYIFLLLVALLLSSCSGTSMNEAQAIVGSENIVREKLKCPTTAKFSDTKIIETARSKEGEPFYLLTTTVDSQNSFGAMVRSYFLVILSFENDNHDQMLYVKDDAAQEIEGSMPTVGDVMAMKFLNFWPDSSTENYLKDK